MPTTRCVIEGDCPGPIEARSIIDGRQYTWYIVVDKPTKSFNAENAKLTYADIADLTITSMQRILSGHIGSKDIDIVFQNGVTIMTIPDMPGRFWMSRCRLRRAALWVREQAPFSLRSSSGTSFTSLVDLAVVPTRRIVSGSIGPKDIEIVFDNGVAITGDLDQVWTGQGGAVVMRTDNPKSAWTVANAAETQTVKGSLLGEGPGPILAEFSSGKRQYIWYISIDKPTEPFNVSNATLNFADSGNLAIVPTRRIVSGRIGPDNIEVVFDIGVTITGDLDQARTLGQKGAVMRTDKPRYAWKVADAAQKQTAKGSVKGEGSGPILATFTVGPRRRLYTWHITVNQRARPFHVSDATLTFADPADVAAIPTQRIISGHLGWKNIEIVFDNGVTITGQLKDSMAYHFDISPDGWKVSDAAKTS